MSAGTSSTPLVLGRDAKDDPADPAGRPGPAGRRAAARVSGRWKVLGGYARRPGSWGGPAVGCAVLAFAAAWFAGLYHPYWVRGGDAELYLSVGRHLVRGEGFVYNGQPVGLIPPLWPLVIAGGMWLTGVVGVLKLMLPLLVLTYLGCAYAVLRRLARPWPCGLAVAAVAVMQPVFQITLWFHSEALFLALSWLGLLLGVQAGERHRARRGGVQWRAGGATLLLVLAVGTRWTGVLWLPMIVAGFLTGRALLRLTPDRRGLVVPLRPRRADAMILWSGGAAWATLATFFALRAWLKVDPADIDYRYDLFITGHYPLTGSDDTLRLDVLAGRLLDLPHWLGVIYWNQLARTRETGPARLVGRGHDARAPGGRRHAGAAGSAVGLARGPRGRCCRSCSSGRTRSTGTCCRWRRCSCWGRSSGTARLAAALGRAAPGGAWWPRVLPAAWVAPAAGVVPGVQRRGVRVGAVGHERPAGAVRAGAGPVAEPHRRPPAAAAAAGARRRWR